MARPLPNVLVVDDDAATRDGLTALLESWGYHALAVPTVRLRCKGATTICLTRL